jgi:hypothetical protein
MSKKMIVLSWMIATLLVCNFSIAQINQEKIIHIEKNQNPKYLIKIMQDLVIGLSNDNEDFLFSSIDQVQVDRKGDIYVSDLRDRCIKVFDKNGKNLRIIGKRGRGPGDILSVAGLSLVGEDQLLISDAGNRRLTYFSTSGEWKRSIPMETKMIARAVEDNKGNIIAKLLVMGKEAKMQIVKFDSDLNPIFKIASKVEEGWNDEYVLRPIKPKLAYGVTKDGKIIWGISSNYELNILNSKGNLIKRIIKDTSPLVISDDYKKEIRENYKNRNIPSNYKIEFPKNFTEFSFFIVEKNGRIYVKTYQMNQNREYYHDVFDAQGEYLAQFALPKGEYISDVKDNKLYCVIRENKDSIPLVKRYNLKWQDISNS